MMLPLAANITSWHGDCCKAGANGVPPPTPPSALASIPAPGEAEEDKTSAPRAFQCGESPSHMAHG
eukprot:9477548-Pyramimonas_sp.AAC.1